MLAAQRGMVMFSFGKEPSKVQASKELFESAADTWQKSIDEVRPLLVTEEGTLLVNQLQEQLRQWRSVGEEISQTVARNDPEAAMRITIVKGKPIYDANSRDTARFRELQNEMLAKQPPKPPASIVPDAGLL